MCTEKKAHKHAAIIKAWADGAKIQCRLGTGEWLDVGDHPTWTRSEYRVKPEPKPDMVMFMHVGNGPTNKHPYPTYSWCGHPATGNLKIVFDGETGKLKDAIVL